MSTKTHSKRAAKWTLGITGAALFMTALDNLVVGVALPSIRADLGGSIESLEWTVNAYTLAFAVLLITGAALGDRFGRKRMFGIGLGDLHRRVGPRGPGAVDRRADRRAGVAGIRRGDRHPAHPHPGLRGVPAREARRRAGDLGRDQRTRRRGRAVRRRARGRGDLLAVDLLAERAAGPRPDPARRADADRVDRAGPGARPARPRARRRRALRPDLRDHPRGVAGLDQRHGADRAGRRRGPPGGVRRPRDEGARADAADAHVPLTRVQRNERAVVRDVLRIVRSDLPAEPVLPDGSGVRPARGRPEDAAVDRDADDRRTDRRRARPALRHAAADGRGPRAPGRRPGVDRDGVRAGHAVRRADRPVRDHRHRACR